jgi:protein-L-isoaspartate(D-aspartate) O-methyltransferase
VPDALVEQLREGGRMIVPVGERYQQTLYLFRKQKGKLTSEALLPTLFVPMTGKAEQGRQVKPDPAHPAVINGGFEELIDGTSRPIGWHYARQMELIAGDKDAPEGKNYVTFSNNQSGRGSQALQGMAVDGRQVAELEISLWVKAKDVVRGQSEKELPTLTIIFYDSTRAQCGNTWVGPWHGSFGWRQQVDHVRVPLHAREAIIRVGLGGATGEISFDDIQIEPGKK